MFTKSQRFISAAGFIMPAALVGWIGQASAADSCADLGLGVNSNAIHSALESALSSVAPNAGINGGLNNNMWATLVDSDGIVCAIAFTGPDRNAQWPGSRVISAQKANTATSFNLSADVGGAVDALSTANLWTQVQPGGSLFGLQHSNPVDTGVAYGGDPSLYGTPNDPMVGKRVGGVNVFGGGLGAYVDGTKVGGIGTSGDTSCADHNIAWRLRDALGLDDLAADSGATVDGLSAAPFQDDIIYDVSTRDQHHAIDNSDSGFGHPVCGFGEEDAVLPPTN